MHRGLALAVIAVLIVLIGGMLVWEHKNAPYLSQFLGATSTTTQPTLITFVTYTCDQGKTIRASFYDTSGIVAEQPQTPGGMPPPPPGSVALVLSDGRSMTLPQTISGSGIRYANQDESFIFWGKGATAFIEEGPNQDQTYQNCVTTDAAPDGGASATSSDATPPDMAPVSQ